MAIGLRFDKGVSAGTANQSREDFAVGDTCTIVATGVVGVATFQVLASPPGSVAALVPVDAVSQDLTLDVAGRWDVRVGDSSDGSRVEHTFAVPTVIKNLIAPAHNERASEDANEADTDPGTWVDESHSNLGGRTTGYAPDVQKVVAAVERSLESAGVVDGGDIADDGDGTVTVAPVRGYLRATDDDVADLASYSIAETAIAPADNDITFVYAEYNAGTSRVVGTVTERTDSNTNNLLGTVHREGTDLHITQRQELVRNAAQRVNQRLVDIEGLTWESGADTSETGTRNIAITAGKFWLGLRRVPFAAFDSSTPTNYFYFYRDSGNPSGWTFDLATQISNTKWDDGSNTLADLTGNRFGVHWVYVAVDGDVYVLYGRGNYTLAQAEEAEPPPDVPPHLQEHHGALAAKVIIQKDAAAFESVESAFGLVFAATGAHSHSAAATTYNNADSALTDTDVKGALDTLSEMSLGAAETGWLSGLDVTINGSNPAEFDVAAGTIRVQGIADPIPAGPFTAEDLPDIATSPFTALSIDAAGQLVKLPRNLTASERRTHAQIQTVLHGDLATITGIDNRLSLGEHLTQAVADYVTAAGIINNGNNYTARAADLTVQKSAGVTTSLGLEAAADLTAPNNQINGAESPVTFVPVYRDFPSGFVFGLATTLVPVGFWDNGSGTLQATPKYVIYQMRFFNQQTGCFVGQTTYDTLEEAAANVFLEDPTLPVAVNVVQNNLRTAIIAKGDVTDFQGGVNVQFIQVSPSFPGGVVQRGTL